MTAGPVGSAIFLLGSEGQTMGRIFDSHAHYDDAAFDADRDELLTALPDMDVGAVITNAVDVASAHRCIALAQRYPYIRVAVGIHPEEVGKATDDHLTQIASLCAHPAVCAVGEIGLDYHYEDAAPKEEQIAWFRRQLALAGEKNLPVVVHDRDAHEDTMTLLREYRPRGVVHCFSGSVEMMREVVGLGMYIGLGGVTTFKNARRPLEVAKAVPLDRLLLETDAPYLAPEPLRGQRCHSGLIAHTAACIAAAREMPVDDLLRITYDNACRLFEVNL